MKYEWHCLMPSIIIGSWPSIQKHSSARVQIPSEFRLRMGSCLILVLELATQTPTTLTFPEVGAGVSGYNVKL